MAAREGGAAGFHACYQQLFGERWPQLHQALLAEPTKYLIPGLQGDYAIDFACWSAIQLLDLQGDESVLDMCAAPGGKALALALRLPRGRLHLNDVSRSRFHRLRQNLSLLPPQLGVELSSSCADASRWGMRHPSSVDCVLLDAPCSSERHLLHSPAHLKQWSPARSRMLAVRQLALSCAACDSLRSGGRLLYLTCALHPQENELLIARLLLKRPVLSELVPREESLSSSAIALLAAAERCRNGALLLPDSVGLGGSGPLYFCLLQKA